MNAGFGLAVPKAPVAVPMAAALATLHVLERDNFIAKIAQTGEALRAGFERLAAQHELPIRYTGHPSIPFMTFANETNFLRSQHFCREAVRRGVFLHPHHNWFLCAAHQPREVIAVLHQDRLVEAVLLAQLFVPGRIDAALARHGLDRIARNEADQHEHQQRDPDEGRNHETDAREKEPEHVALPPLQRRRSTSRAYWPSSTRWRRSLNKGTTPLPHEAQDK